MKTYDCSGPDANPWADRYHGMLMSDYYDTLVVADDYSGAAVAVGGNFVAEVDEYGQRFLHRFPNDAEASAAVEACRHLYESEEAEA